MTRPQAIAFCLLSIRGPVVALQINKRSIRVFEDFCMSYPMFFDSARDHLRTRLTELDQKRGWFFALGIFLVLLGVAALYMDVATTMLTIVVLGGILIAASVVLAVFSFVTGRWSGFLLTLAAAALSAIAGITMLTNPLLGAAAITLAIGTIFIVGGIYRSIASAVMQFPNWGWSLLNGLITLALGIMLVRGWPSSSLWFLGLFVGIDLIFHGVSWIMFALGVHRVASLEFPEEERRAA
jgi:uncharacterized membrane protein HdeD (DUF308 family)